MIVEDRIGWVDLLNSGRLGTNIRGYRGQIDHPQHPGLFPIGLGSPSRERVEEPADFPDVHLFSSGSPIRADNETRLEGQSIDAGQISGRVALGTYQGRLQLDDHLSVEIRPIEEFFDGSLPASFQYTCANVPTLSPGVQPR